MTFVVRTVSKTTSEGVTKMQINRQVQGKLSEEVEEKDKTNEFFNLREACKKSTLHSNIQ